MPVHIDNVVFAHVLLTVHDDFVALLQTVQDLDFSLTHYRARSHWAHLGVSVFDTNHHRLLIVFVLDDRDRWYRRSLRFLTLDADETRDASLDPISRICDLNDGRHDA